MGDINILDRETYPEYATPPGPADGQQLVQCGMDRAQIVLGFLMSLEAVGYTKEEALYLTAHCLRIT